MTEINKKTTVSLSLVTTLIIVAFSAGGLWWKVNSMEKQITIVQEDIREIYDLLIPKFARNE